MKYYVVRYYPKQEEFFNVLTHFVGFILSGIGLALLVTFASIYGTVWHIVGFSIFGSSMVLVYLSSTLYHRAKNRRLRRKLNILDHASIYVLIAGTYTPFCLIPLNGTLGWVLFGIIWGIAIAGVILKLFYTGRFDKLSTIGYVLMGWVGLIALKSLVESLSFSALMFLALGGLSYTVGAVFYSLKRMPFSHVIFHCFVLIGSASHFVCVFFFLL